jgi:hypothetical protein
MKMRTFAAASAALGLLATASAANAVVTYDHKNANQLFDLDSGTVLLDFDGIADARVSYNGASQPAENPVGDSAAPPYTGDGAIPICCELNSDDDYLADPTNYASVQGGQTRTLSAVDGWHFTSFSFYMGSPDEYNTLTFNYVGGGSEVFVGNSIWGGSPAGDGTRGAGYRVYYDFGGAKVSSISFTSSADAFEWDGAAGTLGVPEPGTWALMIMGFGGAGAMLRRRKLAVA